MIQNFAELGQQALRDAETANRLVTEKSVEAARAEEAYRIARARAVLRAEGSSVAERKAHADKDPVALKARMDRELAEAVRWEAVRAFELKKMNCEMLRSWAAAERSLAHLSGRMGET